MNNRQHYLTARLAEMWARRSDEFDRPRNRRSKLRTIFEAYQRSRLGEETVYMSWTPRGWHIGIEPPSAAGFYAFAVDGSVGYTMARARREMKGAA